MTLVETSAELSRISLDYADEMTSFDLDLLRYHQDYEDEVRLRAERQTPLAQSWVKKIAKVSIYNKVAQAAHLHSLLPLLFLPITPGDVKWNIKRLRESCMFAQESFKDFHEEDIEWAIAHSIQRYLQKDVRLQKDDSLYCGMDAHAYLTTGNWNAPSLGDTAPRDQILGMVRQELLCPRNQSC